MINKDILYLKKSNRSTIIKYLDKNEIVIDRLFEDILDEALEKDLTTLKGRLESTSRVYHIFKHIPIYLQEDIILIQTANKKQIDNIYINSYNILDIKEKSKDYTIIIFVDDSSLEINKPYRLVKKYYDLSFKIKKLI